MLGLKEPLLFENVQGFFKIVTEGYLAVVFRLYCTIEAVVF